MTSKDGSKRLTLELRRRFRETAWSPDLQEAQQLAVRMLGYGVMSPDEVRATWEKWRVLQSVAAALAGMRDTSTIAQPHFFCEAEDLIDALEMAGCTVVIMAESRDPASHGLAPTGRLAGGANHSIG